MGRVMKKKERKHMKNADMNPFLISTGLLH
jgi:hypothetical protein